MARRNKCLCFPLRTGLFLLASLHFVIGVLGFFFFLFGLNLQKSGQDDLQYVRLVEFMRGAGIRLDFDRLLRTITIWGAAYLVLCIPGVLEVWAGKTEAIKPTAFSAFCELAAIIPLIISAVVWLRLKIYSIGILDILSALFTFLVALTLFKAARKLERREIHPELAVIPSLSTIQSNPSSLQVVYSYNPVMPMVPHEPTLMKPIAPSLPRRSTKKSMHHKHDHDHEESRSKGMDREGSFETKSQVYRQYRASRPELEIDVEALKAKMKEKEKGRHRHSKDNEEKRKSSEKDSDDDEDEHHHSRHRHHKRSTH